MLEVFTSKPKTREFLHLYPKSDWLECLSCVSTIGILSIEAAYHRFLPLNDLRFIADNTPLPLHFQIPELKSTIITMKEAIDKINSSMEKENEDLKKLSRRSLSRKSQKIKKSTPNPILVESTPRFKVLDDAFNKQKWKKENQINLIREENNKSPLLTKSVQKPKVTQRSADRRPLRAPVGGENKIKPNNLHLEGGVTDRPYAASPTLEELLSNSRFTTREDGKQNKNDEMSGSELKQSFEGSVVRKNSKHATLVGQQKCAVTIAEGFLKNPLISQLAHKGKQKTQCEVQDEDTASKMSIRSCSPINSIMALDKDEF